MEAKLYGQNKGGMSINGIIKDYYAYAGENISAGDLVEYVNGVAGKTEETSIDTAIDNINTNTGFAISAVCLDNNRVFIAHSYGTDKYLYGIICTINGAKITYGKDTQLSTTANTGQKISAVLLPNGNVFIAHSYDTKCYLYGMAVTINGNDISYGVDTQLNAGQNSGKSISACLLPNGKVFIAYNGNSSSYYLYAMVVSINGTEIKQETYKSLVGADYASYTISTCVLPDGNVFIAHSRGSNYQLYGIVCTISGNGTIITPGSDTKINTVEDAGSQISTCLLPNGNVFVAFGVTSTNKYTLIGIVCVVSGTTISAGAQKTISTATYAAYYTSAVTLPNGNVLLMHSSSNTQNLYGAILAIDGTTIASVTDTLLNSTNYSGSKVDLLLLSNGTIFAIHSDGATTGYHLYAQIFGIDYDNNIPTNNIVITEYETQVRKVTTGQFDGIAKTSGEGSPEFVEGEVKKTGNIFKKNWVQVSTTEYLADDGIKLTSTPMYSSDLLTNACDENIDTSCRINAIFNTGSIYKAWAMIELPEPIAITKFYINANVSTGNSSIRLEASNDNSEWVSLQTSSYELKGEYTTNLLQTDKYKFYRLLSNSGTNSSGYMTVYDWQVLEYWGIGLIPNPNIGHKDIVSIWTKVPIVTQEVTMADGNTLADANGDIFLVREAS